MPARPSLTGAAHNWAPRRQPATAHLLPRLPGPHPSAGAVAVKKDAKKESHDQVDVPNLHMMKEMVSFKSRGFVTETFSW